jgi:acetyl-CoA carboxylase biotin carboxyl carrier protein
MAKDTKGKGGAEQGLIRELAGLLEETGLSEIEVEREGLRVRVSRQMSVQAMPLAAAPAASAAAPNASVAAPAASAQAAAAPAAAGPDLSKHPGALKSPMVGTAYLGAQPGDPPFVEMGSKVTQGQTILIIEAMKTMNHIPAPKAGVVTAILVGNGQPVEFGELLAIIE